MIGTTLRRYLSDWEPVPVRDNVVIDPTAHIDSAFSFDLCRSELAVGISLGRGSQVLIGTMLDVGIAGRIVLGECAMVNGSWLIADCDIFIGAYSMTSWSVVVTDNYRFPRDPVKRREELQKLPFREGRRPASGEIPRPVRIGSNVWIGFEAIVLPGVTIGDGAVVGARSVVFEDVEPYTIVAGNPARFVRRLTPPEGNS